MTDETITVEKLDQLRKVATAAQAKAPSPWDRDTVKIREESSAYNVLEDANGKDWADSANSSMAMICEDVDEDGSNYYDCGTWEVFEHWKTFDPATVLRLLDELERRHALIVNLRGDYGMLEDAAAGLELDIMAEHEYAGRLVAVLRACQGVFGNEDPYQELAGRIAEAVAAKPDGNKASGELDRLRSENAALQAKANHMEHWMLRAQTAEAHLRNMIDLVLDGDASAMSETQYIRDGDTVTIELGYAEKVRAAAAAVPPPPPGPDQIGPLLDKPV